MESKIDIARNCLRFDIVKKDNINMLNIYKVTYNGFQSYKVNKTLMMITEIKSVNPESYVKCLIEKINKSFNTFKLSDDSLKNKLTTLIQS
jgi:tRNA A37 threonylcarbamoyladenosine dehydratase